ncbi:DUF721 domain-containing protein [Neiella sp. HB171785]|uniref:DUF721 domain-containing protein n=1 Tax=Neiella litorisoli TaxID=2771431 RepID=A0A8J6R361_9GAMM|nr:DciA family protein [Neiella litorisoli]MBD1389965.1 DUF721 domain-containing protein [Neiella litorisoli]
MSKANRQPVAFNQIVQSNRSGLANIARRSQALQSLQQQFAKVIDDDLRGHCRVVSYQQGVLSLSVDSPVWQWRLNMNKTAILAKLRQSGFTALTTLESQVKPTATIQSQQDSGFHVNRQISHQTATDLRQLAESTPEPLKSQLLKLASREKTKPA